LLKTFESFEFNGNIEKNNNFEPIFFQNKLTYYVTGLSQIQPMVFTNN